MLGVLQRSGESRFIDLVNRSSPPSDPQRSSNQKPLMAVDLYCYVERHEGGIWQLVGELVPNDARQYDPEAPELTPTPVLHSVNRELASILVDTGWAIRAAEPYTAIVPRRGKPKNLPRAFRVLPLL